MVIKVKILWQMKKGSVRNSDIDKRVWGMYFPLTVPQCVIRAYRSNFLELAALWSTIPFETLIPIIKSFQA